MVVILVNTTDWKVSCLSRLNIVIFRTDRTSCQLVERRQRMVMETWYLPRCGRTSNLTRHFISWEIRRASWLLSDGKLQEAARPMARALKWMAYLDPALLWDRGLNSHLPCLKEKVIIREQHFGLYRHIFGEFPDLPS